MWRHERKRRWKPRIHTNTYKICKNTKRGKNHAHHHYPRGVLFPWLVAASLCVLSSRPWWEHKKRVLIKQMKDSLKKQITIRSSNFPSSAHTTASHEGYHFPYREGLSMRGWIKRFGLWLKESRWGGGGGRGVQKGLVKNMSGSFRFF